MADDGAVVVLGEDVGALGGVFRVTEGLAAEFGADRCLDTPAGEAGIVGLAVGMAMRGFRPVVELQFDAFAYPAFEQVTSHVAKLRNRTGGKLGLPLVIRIPYGGGIGAVEHHSDSSEAYYTSTPGLSVVTPATVPDGYSLLREAIASPEDGWDLEVVDLRSLAPFDEETVGASVARTGRAVVVHEAPIFGGYGAEVAARVTERCFHYLEAPVARVGGLDIPYPPPALEAHHLPSVDRILDAVAELQWEDAA
jgi:pyruvate dehydrogenase E1 component beta subunit